MAVGRAKITENRVEIPGQLEFDVDKATIRQTDQSKEILNTLKDFLAQNKNVTKLQIQGHTDNSGNADHNKKLSQERADAVVKWLGDNGVDKTRIIGIGFGPDKPVAPNDTAENKQKNRRTEFHVLELDGKPVGGGTSASAPPAGSAAPATQSPAGKAPDATPAGSAAPASTPPKKAEPKAVKKP
jgi:hypothetical protein